MKKTSLFLVALFSLVLGFVGCEKDEPDITQVNNPITEINAKVENGAALNGVVTKVRMLADDDINTTILSEAKFENGGFNMKLNPVTDTDLLINVGYDMPDGAQISDLNANTLAVSSLSAYSSTSKSYVGSFIYAKNYSFMKESLSFDYVALIYTDRNVSIKADGEVYDEYFHVTFKIEVDLNLKKGWNMVRMLLNGESGGESDYMKVNITDISNVSGYKWVYIPDDFDIPFKQKDFNKLFR